MTNLPTIYTITFNEQERKVRLDKFLAANITEHSRTRIQRLVKTGYLKVNNEIVKINDIKLNCGDTLVLELPAEENYQLKKCNLNLDVVFEDDDLLIINKPAGLSVHPGAGNYQDTLVNILVNNYPNNLSSIGDWTRPGIVHRLDKDTSGLMIIAKNNFTHFKLSSMLEKRTIKRTYLALIYGILHPSIGMITTQFGRSKRDPKKMCVYRTGGKTAITDYRVLQTFCNNTLSLIECNLQTGRTHQIRVHMEYLNHPIIGDQTYGKHLNFNLNHLNDIQKTTVQLFKRQALHAYKLSFNHPRTHQALNFESEVTSDIKGLFQILA